MLKWINLCILIANTVYIICVRINISLTHCLFFILSPSFFPFHSTLASSLQHGADPTKKNRDGNTPLDLVKDGDTDIQDLLRGDAALLDAAKKGCLARVQKLCSPDNINCRDTQGRNSTPLHLAGGWSSLCRHIKTKDKA